MKKTILTITVLLLSGYANAAQKFLGCTLNDGHRMSILMRDISDEPRILVKDASFKVEVVEGDLGTMILLSTLDGRATATVEATENQLSGNDMVSLGLNLAGNKKGHVNCEITL